MRNALPPQTPLVYLECLEALERLLQGIHSLVLSLHETLVTGPEDRLSVWRGERLINRTGEAL